MTLRCGNEPRMAGNVGAHGAGSSEKSVQGLPSCHYGEELPTEKLAKCLISLARSERFELPTLGIEIRCSIQLSYERVSRFDYQTWPGWASRRSRKRLPRRRPDVVRTSFAPIGALVRVPARECLCGQVGSPICALRTPTSSFVPERSCASRLSPWFCRCLSPPCRRTPLASRSRACRALRI
jgi:hypothetical protein